MAIEPPLAGRTLIFDGLAQNDLDMANHQLLNLDTSNLPPVGIPPTIVLPQNQWLHGWDSITHTWTASQPLFDDLSGRLTDVQMTNITKVGDVRVGTWNASPLEPEKVPTLDLIRSPAGNVSLASKRITNLADPIDANDAVNLSFVEAMLPGLKPKAAVRCASTAYIPGGPNDLITIDGIHLEENDRVLLKDQPTTRRYEHGIWIAHDGLWERPEDFDGIPDDSELVLATVHVLDGTLNIGTTWVQITPSPVRIHVDADPDKYPRFILFESSGAAIVAGAGLERIGNLLNVLGTEDRISVNGTVDIDPAYAGQPSITTLGDIATGTWQADVIMGNFGGTGMNNGAWTISLVGNFALVETFDAVGETSLSCAVSGPSLVSFPQSGFLATRTGTETLTNKRITRRLTTIFSNAQPSINTDNVDIFNISNLGENITSMSNNLTGTPTDRQQLEIWIQQASGAGPGAKTIAWGSKFLDSPDLVLPTVAIPGKYIYMLFSYIDDFHQWALIQKLGNLS